MSTAPGSILLITNLPFWHGGTGTHQRILGLTRFLQHHYTLHVLFLNRLSREDQALLARSFPDLTVHTPSCTSVFLRKARRRTKKILARCCPNLDSVWNDSYAEDCQTAQKTVAQIRPAAVIVEYAYLAKLGEAVKRSSPDIVTVLDTIDAIALRTQRLAEQGLGDGQPGLRPEEEAGRLCHFDAVLAIQEEEAKYFRELLPEKPVLLAGHPEHVRPFAFSAQDSVSMLFVGADTEHNRAAINDFLSEVWPVLQKKFGDNVTLKIVGRIADSLRTDDELAGIALMGFVDDLEEVYRRADIVVNPIFAGSGLKIKNVEALCHGKCLVTTPLGAQGFSKSDTAPMAICDSMNAMIDTLSLLIDDAAQRKTYAERAHQYAIENLGEAVVFSELSQWLQETVREAPES